MSNTFFSDDLSDLLGAPAQAAPRELPQAPELARVRAAVEAQPMQACPRCAGTGYTRWGICFKCNGKAKIKGFKTPAPVRAANREKAAARKERSAQMNWDAFVVTYPAQAQVLTRGANSNNPSWSNICLDVMGKVRKYGDLHPGTMAMLDRAVARDAERAAQKAAAPRQEAPAALVNLRAAFDAVVSKGAKKAQMTVGDVNVSLASLSGRNPGALYVKFKGEYAGKVVGTTFQGRNAAPELMAALAVIEADPTAAIKAQAATAAQLIAEAVARGEEPQVPCGCCGILLTDPESRARGIGPICAGKWGF